MRFKKLEIQHRRGVKVISERMMKGDPKTLALKSRAQPVQTSAHAERVLVAIVLK